MHLQESIAEGARQHFATSVLPWRILRGKEHELGMGTNDCVGFGNVQLAIIIKKSIQGFEVENTEGEGSIIRSMISSFR